MSDLPWQIKNLGNWGDSMFVQRQYEFIYDYIMTHLNSHPNKEVLFSNFQRIYLLFLNFPTREQLEKVLDDENEIEKVLKNKFFVGGFVLTTYHSKMNHVYIELIHSHCKRGTKISFTFCKELKSLFEITEKGKEGFFVFFRSVLDSDLFQYFLNCQIEALEIDYCEYSELVQALLSEIENNMEKMCGNTDTKEFFRYCKHVLRYYLDHITDESSSCFAMDLLVGQVPEFKKPYSFFRLLESNSNKKIKVN